jgi:membrane protein
MRRVVLQLSRADSPRRTFRISLMATSPGNYPDLRRAWRFLRALMREYHQSGGHDSAASLTYTTLFAVVPVMTVAFAILKFSPQLAGVSDRIEALVFENFVPATGAQVQQYLKAFSAQASSLTAIGVGFLFVTALLMLLAVERVFNRIWRVHRPRRLMSSLLVYWALLTLGPLLLGSGIAASSYLMSMSLVTDTVGRMGGMGQILMFVPFLMSAVFFSIAYIAVPNCNVPIREGIIGGVVAALLLELARQSFAYFMMRFSGYQLVYGAFAAVPLFLLWIYISWVITLFGVVLVYVLANWDDEDVRAATPFPALLKVLGLFRLRQHAGMAVSDREARHVALHAGIDNWHDLRERLLAQGLIERSDSGLLLASDLHKLRMSDLARLVPWDLLDTAVNTRGEPDAFAQEVADTLCNAVRAFDAALDEPVAVVLDRLPPDVLGVR